jgi:hypothetical protein
MKDLPSASAEAERYQGRPLLIILENYILSCVGELEPEAEATAALAVQRVFGGGPDWHATLRRLLTIPEPVEESLRSMWQRNLLIAKQAGTSILPVQFAKAVADENFAPLIDRIPK